MFAILITLSLPIFILYIFVNEKTIDARRWFPPEVCDTEGQRFGLLGLLFGC